MNLPEDVGFFGLGVLIGGLLIDLRYRYNSLVAHRLMEKSEAKPDPWWKNVSGEVKGAMLLIPVIVLSIAFLISMIVGTVIYYNRMEIEAAKEGVVVEKATNGTSRWVKTSVPTVPKKAEAEEK